VALALYRKYRPISFAEVIGQDHVTEPLIQALRSGRLNHAYLFSGPRGCGKTSSARILARSLNCEQGPTPDPCGECGSCRGLAADGPGSIDVIEIDAASHGGVDDARELRERAFFAPASSRFKIYIIDEAHMVSSAGFNALLKLVEEPPEYVKFVFATTEPEKVLGTIKSRTHHYPFRLIPPGTLRPYLEKLAASEGVKVEPQVFPLVVRAGGGSARDTLSVLDQLIAGSGEGGVTYARAVSLLGVTDVALIDDMADALAANDGAAAFATIDALAEAGHDARRFAGDLLERLRDLIILRQIPDAVAKGILDAPADELARMQDQAGRLGDATLSRCADIVHNGLVEMRGAASPRLLLELVVARMLLPANDDSLSALLQRVERLESGAVSLPASFSAPSSVPGSVSASGATVLSPSSDPGYGSAGAAQAAARQAASAAASRAYTGGSARSAPAASQSPAAGSTSSAPASAGGPPSQSAGGVPSAAATSPSADTNSSSAAVGGHSAGSAGAALGDGTTAGGPSSLVSPSLNAAVAGDSAADAGRSPSGSADSAAAGRPAPSSASADGDWEGPDYDDDLPPDPWESASPVPPGRAQPSASQPSAPGAPASPNRAPSAAASSGRQPTPVGDDGWPTAASPGQVATTADRPQQTDVPAPRQTAPSLSDGVAPAAGSGGSSSPAGSGASNGSGVSSGSSPSAAEPDASHSSDSSTPSGIDPPTVRRHWDEIVRMVGQGSKKAAAFAREAVVREVEGNALILVFKHKIHADGVTNDPGPLTSAVNQVLGGSWRLRCEVGGDNRQQPRSAAPAQQRQAPAPPPPPPAAAATKPRPQAAAAPSRTAPTRPPAAELAPTDEEAPYDPEFDGPPSAAARDGFDPGDEPDVDTDSLTHSQTGEQHALESLRQRFNVEKL
jgi:DNA polymerase-3 subunit gamma/tau